MTVFEAFLLGGVQGITEFLPISSSGHLVLVQYLLHIKEPMIAFDIAVHIGTLVAVGVYFWKDIIMILYHGLMFAIKFPVIKDQEKLIEKYPYSLTAGYIVLSMLATMIMGLLFYQLFEFFFRSVLSVGVAWIVMSFFFFISKGFDSEDRNLELMNHKDAFLIGLAQGIALIPGISRSGATILMALYCGMSKKDSARYSFLLAFPTVLGVAIFEFHEVFAFWHDNSVVLMAGMVASAVIGYLALFLLVWLTKRGKFYYFGFYCAAVGLFAVVSAFLPH
ncbi:MAG: undecaprenyl-diphosphate phosphatase [Candidatus Omnitrophica bacterium]|nr:undecaprenyl-diphosphate phosphatase [Candidatus Omnitrophota bacterium]